MMVTVNIENMEITIPVRKGKRRLLTDPTKAKVGKKRVWNKFINNPALYYRLLEKLLKIENDINKEKQK